MFKKIGENQQITIEKSSSVSSELNEEVLNSFRKLAGDIKRIAPKADDFLYFSTVMMSAAEHSAINEDGSPKLTASGEEVKVSWDKSGDSWKWVSNDPTVRAYKNSNGDIFPEEELVKAHKKWVGKPLCIDHKSSSVDHVRGFIVDTYYDRSLKRVVALCALDKKGFPQLARQVETGVSNSVSMGTAVGKAICYDCAKVARVEADFCDHMRRKSCYGEINVDLSPIELSIVVNGADPKATIKHIIASAKTLNDYVDGKTYELNKLAAQNYSATLTFNNDDGEGSGENKNITIYSKSLEELKKDVAAAISDYEDISSVIKEENILEDSDPTNDMISTQLPSEKTAKIQDVDSKSIEELKQVQASIESKLDLLTANLSKLENNFTNKQEETMSGKEINKSAYYLGTEEPTPGQAKYKEDPADAKVRSVADDFTHGRYSRTDMGPVDGLFGDDLEKKRLLARATADERAQKRAEAVAKFKEGLEKKSYYLNDMDKKDNVGTPTPGKVKYEVSKEDLKTKKDREEYELGKKSLLPYFKDDEAKKKLLNRASLRASFVKASKNDGSTDLGKSAWQVFLGDKLILTASVEDIAGEASQEAYSDIATKEMGKELLEQVKSAGADGVRAMFKTAQELPEGQVPPAALPAAPAPDAGGEVPADTGKTGDPKEVVLSLAEKVQDTVSDLLEAIRALTGEQAEMGELSGEMTAQASGQMFEVRKEINSDLIATMKQAVAELNAANDELSDVASTYDLTNDSNRASVDEIAKDTISEAKTSIADSHEVLRAFVRYAAGTKALEKKAAAQAELKKLAQTEDLGLGDDDIMDKHTEDLMDLIDETNEDLRNVEDMVASDEDEGGLEEDELSDDEFARSLLEDQTDLHLADVKIKKDELKDLGTLPAGSTVQVTAGLESKASRQAWRTKLAKEALDIDEVLYEAHPNGGTDTEVGDKTNLSRVEDLVETHEVMVDVALSPVRVRKEAETLNELISNGSIPVSDLGELVSQGGLDKAVVDYWKKYYSMFDGGKEFADELLKEHTKAEMENDLNAYKVKIARAYELTYEMVDRGLCSGNREAIASQVNEVMQFNDEGFESLKKVVAKYSPSMQKTASGKMPQVGYLSHDSLSEKSEPSMLDQLTNALGKSKGMF